MAKIVHTIDTCTGKIVRVDVNGKHIDLSFRSNEPKQEEIDSAIAGLEKRIVEEDSKPIVSESFIEVLQAAELACAKVAEQWSTTASKEYPELSTRIEKIVPSAVVKAK